MCPIARVPFRRSSSSCAENLRNEAHVPCVGKGGPGAVAGDDARAFLSAMLQREQAVIGQDGRVRMAEHAKEPALMLRERIALALRSVVLSGGDHTADNCFKLRAVQRIVIADGSNEPANESSSLGEPSTNDVDSRSLHKLGILGCRIAFHRAADRVPPNIVNFATAREILAANRDP